MIPMMQHYGLGLTVWSPLAAGFLTGKYKGGAIPNPDDRLSGFDVLPTNKEVGFKLIEQLGVMAERHNASIAQVAYAWLLSKPAVTSVLIGSTKRSQLDDNLKAIDLQLAAEEINQLDATTTPSPVYPNWFIDNAYDQVAAQALSTTRF